MGNDTAEVGAQKRDHESSKEDVGSQLGEKIEDRPSTNGAQPLFKHAATEPGTEHRDLEKVQTEIQDSEPVKVPRSQRRGLFARLTILAEVEDPKHYSQRVKWYITFVIALAAVAAPLGSTIIFRMRPGASTTALANTSQLPFFRSQRTCIPPQQSPTSQSPCICFPCPYFHFGGLHFQRPWDDVPFISYHSLYLYYSILLQQCLRTSPCSSSCECWVAGQQPVSRQ